MIFFPQVILAATSPVMEGPAYQLKMETFTNACVQRDITEKSAKKVLEEHVRFEGINSPKF